MTERHLPFYEPHAEVATALELQLLKQHEPHIEFRIVGANEAGLSTGRQSRVSVLEYDRKGETYRLLWKRMAAGKRLDHEEARLLDSRLEPYRKSLMESGWKIPSLYHHRVSDFETESQIFSYEQYIRGGDGEKMLQDSLQPNFRKWFLVEGVIRTLYNYPAEQLHRSFLAGKGVTCLPHGLDLKLANVVLEDKTNELYFVDLFGPKELDGYGEWFTFNTKLDQLEPEALLAVCATREGAILRCWRLAEAMWNNGQRDIIELRNEFIEHLESISLPDEELLFIRSEINAGYPWLDNIYLESNV